jgi:hypothetical protein
MTRSTYDKNIPNMVVGIERNHTLIAIPSREIPFLLWPRPFLFFGREDDLSWVIKGRREPDT